jgi:hypothetical protein
MGLGQAVGIPAMRVAAVNINAPSIHGKGIPMVIATSAPIMAITAPPAPRKIMCVVTESYLFNTGYFSKS